MAKKAKEESSEDFSDGSYGDAGASGSEGGVTVSEEEVEQPKPTTSEKDPAKQWFFLFFVAAEERKKLKKIEQLDKRIKFLVKRKEKDREVLKEASEIKNKHKRLEVVQRKRIAKQDEKVIERLKKKKIRYEQGEEAMPIPYFMVMENRVLCVKGKTETIESMRVADDTLIQDGNDEDIQGEQQIDEFSEYFKNITTPKILMTTNRRPKGGIFDFLKEIKEAIPAVEYYERKNYKVKDIISWGKKRGYTDLLLWYEKHGQPHTLIMSHLPDGPTATFRVSGVKLRDTLPNHGRPTSHDYSPEMILNNFDTMTGHRIGRMIAALFPQNPTFVGRKVITFHNQRDFIFFRHHRYEFAADGSRANLQEVGPRFTLKLHALQLGTLDSKFGEYEFIYKPRMGVNRKQMYL